MDVLRRSRDNTYRILVPVGNPDQMALLLSLAVPIARAHKGVVLMLYVGTRDEPPPWLIIDPEIRDVVADPEALADRDISGAILDYVREQEWLPDLLLLHWKGQESRGRHILGKTLDPLIQNAPCNVAILSTDESPTQLSQRIESIERILVPSAGGPNAAMAISLGLDLSPSASVTALRVAKRTLGPTAITAQREILEANLEQFEDRSRIFPRVSLADGVVDGILEQARNQCDLLLIGATRESLVDRVLFGNLPQQLALRSPVPVLIVRRRESGAAQALRQARWRLVRALPQLTLDERVTVYRLVRRNARSSTDYYVMMILSAAIASLGLLLDNPSIIIGAMIMAPLMSSLLGIALSVVQGDSWMLRLSLRTAILGVFLVLAVSVALGLLMPVKRITTEMLVRTSPNLLDLGVALTSGAAAAYATSRKQVASALAGVAIAVALVPPLATVGLTFASGDARAGMGALLLALTNLAAIVSAATLVFLWMGFHPERASEGRARTFRGGVLGTVGLLVAITVVLGILTVGHVRESQFARSVETAMDDSLPRVIPGADLSSWEVVDADEQGLHMDATIHAPVDLSQENVAALQEAISAVLGRPVSLSLSVIRTVQVTH